MKLSRERCRFVDISFVSLCMPRLFLCLVRRRRYLLSHSLYYFPHVVVSRTPSRVVARRHDTFTRSNSSLYVPYYMFHKILKAPKHVTSLKDWICQTVTQSHVFEPSRSSNVKQYYAQQVSCSQASLSAVVWFQNQLC